MLSKRDSAMLLERDSTLTALPARAVAPPLILVSTSAFAVTSIVEPMSRSMRPPPYEPALPSAFFPLTNAGELRSGLKLWAERKYTLPVLLVTTAPLLA